MSGRVSKRYKTFASKAQDQVLDLRFIWLRRFGWSSNSGGAGSCDLHLAIAVRCNSVGYEPIPKALLGLLCENSFSKLGRPTNR